MGESIYLNIWEYADLRFPFQIFVGPRGKGKTYSALKGALSGQCEGRFIFMRRTAAELDLLLDTPKGEGANPFKAVNRDLSRNVGMRSIVKNIAGIYNRKEEEGKLMPIGEPLGYGLALSTVSSIRGVDFSDVTDLIYDEFIPEKHVKRMRGEADAFLNAYESLNRNREFDGKPPIRCWLLANSNDIYNPLFEGLQIVNEVEKMMRAGKSDRYLADRGLAIHLVEASGEFTEKKSRTALYKLSHGTTFADMALSNEFAYNDFSLIESRPLKGYRPICCINDAYVYQKKGAREYYVSNTPAKCPRFSANTEQDRRRWILTYGMPLMPEFIAGNIVFETYALKSLVLDLIL